MASVHAYMCEMIYNLSMHARAWLVVGACGGGEPACVRVSISVVGEQALVCASMLMIYTDR